MHIDFISKEIEKQNKARAIGEGDEVVVFVDVLVRHDETLGRALAHHVMHVLDKAHFFQQLERWRQRVGEQLAVSLAGDGGDGARHRTDDVAHREADVEALARATALHADAVFRIE